MDADCVQQVRDAAGGNKFGNRILRDCARSFLSCTADEYLLDGIPHDFASDTTRPAHGRLVESLSLPPIGIATGRVHGDFETTRQSFAELIPRHKEAFAFVPAE
jgi:hypothetical protein